MTKKAILKDVSLITTLYNEADTIDNFLMSIKEQKVYPQEFVIVDGGSTDGTIEKIQNFSQENPEINIKLIIDLNCSKKYSKAPIAKGRNKAIRNTKGHIIAVTDAGCIVNENWLKEITFAFFKDKTVDIISGYYKAIIKNIFQKRLSKIMVPKIEKLDLNKFLPSSRSVAFNRACWKAVGGYPELTYNAEDTLFDLKMRAIGCKFVFNPNAIVHWEIPKTYRELWRKVYQYGYGNGQLGLFPLKNLLKLGVIFFPFLLILVQREELILKYFTLVASTIGWIIGFLKRLP